MGKRQRFPGPRPLGLVGAGLIGSTLARLAVTVVLDVVLSNSRGPDTLTDLVTQLGDHARAGTPADAASDGGLVVAAVPLGVHRQLPAAALAAKAVIDTMNYYRNATAASRSWTRTPCRSSVLPAACG